MSSRTRRALDPVRTSSKLLSVVKHLANKMVTSTFNLMSIVNVRKTKSLLLQPKIELIYQVFVIKFKSTVTYIAKINKKYR